MKMKKAFAAAAIMALGVLTGGASQAAIQFDTNWNPTGGKFTCTSPQQFGTFVITPVAGKKLSVQLNGGPVYTLGQSLVSPDGAYWSGMMNQLSVGFVAQKVTIPGMPPVRLTTTYMNKPTDWNCN